VVLAKAGILELADNVARDEADNTPCTEVADRLLIMCCTGRDPVMVAVHLPPLVNLTLSAPNASDRLLNGPNTGPPDSLMSAHQLPSESGSTWLARVICSFPSSSRDGPGRQGTGGAGLGGQTRESAPIPDGARSVPVSEGRSEPGWTSRLRHYRLGWIHCRGRLLMHRHLQAQVGVTRCLEGGCGPAAAGVFTRWSGWIHGL